MVQQNLYGKRKMQCMYYRKHQYKASIASEHRFWVDVSHLSTVYHSTSSHFTSTAAKKREFVIMTKILVNHLEEKPLVSALYNT
jgi:hypothetical protein